MRIVAMTARQGSRLAALARQSAVRSAWTVARSNPHLGVAAFAALQPHRLVVVMLRILQLGLIDCWFAESGELAGRGHSAIVVGQDSFWRNFQTVHCQLVFLQHRQVDQPITRQVPHHPSKGLSTGPAVLTVACITGSPLRMPYSRPWHIYRRGSCNVAGPSLLSSADFFKHAEH
jgi:hypothetical protein